MRRKLATVGGVLGLLALAATASLAVVQPCPLDRNCAEVAIDGPSRPAAVGDTVLIRLALVQGDDDQHAGGIDALAAVTATVGIAGLTLADCSAPDGNGLNPSFSLLPGSAGRYRVFVQNLTCAGRASCLCPTAGEARDEYVNLLLTGAAGAAGVQALPNGELLSIALHVPADAGPHLALHIYSALDDSAVLPRPAAGAWLSVADGRATDLTIDAGSGTMNVRVTDGSLTIGSSTPTPAATNTSVATATVTASPSVPSTVTATFAAATPTPIASSTVTATVTAVPCIGDCDDSGEITVNELIAGVGIVLGSLPPSTCPAFECLSGGGVDVSCLVAGVNAALNGCPGRAVR